MLRVRVAAATALYVLAFVVPGSVGIYRLNYPAEGKRVAEALFDSRLMEVYVGLGLLAGLVYIGALGTERQRAKSEAKRRGFPLDGPARGTDGPQLPAAANVPPYAKSAMANAIPKAAFFSANITCIVTLGLAAELSRSDEVWPRMVTIAGILLNLLVSFWAIPTRRTLRTNESAGFQEQTR